MRFLGLRKYIYLLYLLLVMFGVTIFLYMKFDMVITITSKEFQNLKIAEMKREAQAIENILSKILPTNENIFSYIEQHEDIRKLLDEILSSFINKENRYVYIIYQDGRGNFRYLADGAPDEMEKGFFQQKFFPLQERKWKEAFENFTPKIFLQNKITNLWITMLYPLSLFKDIKAFLVVDLSTHAYRNIHSILTQLQNYLRYLLLFFVSIFILVTFLYFFLYREYKKSYTDSLTGAYNRAYLEHIKNRVERENIAIGMIDLDYFKFINDLYGHAVGDEALKKIAKLIQRNIRKDDILIRYGGDEFLLLLNRCPDTDCKEVFRRIHALINKSALELKNGVKTNLGCSIGVNLVPAKETDFTEALKKADTQLYMAKHKGRNRIEIYDEKSAQKGYLGLEKITQLIQEKKVSLFYQPIYNFKTAKIDKYEALARLQEDDTIYLPYQFIPTIHQTNIYRDFTKLVVQKAIETIHEQRVSISVNFNKSDFLDDDFFATIKELILSNKNIAPYLTLEFLENEELKYDDKIILQRIKYFKNAGCSIALDDFGSGYSNLNYFLSLKPDILKIDGTLIKQITINENAPKILRSIVTFARYMDIETVAEFVEDEDIFNILQKMGINYAQGYYIAKPAPTLVRDFGKVLKSVDTDTL